MEAVNVTVEKKGKGGYKYHELLVIYKISSFI